MPKKKSIDRIFKALADGHRREIFHLLMVTASALSLSQISSEFDMTRQGVTKHVKIMEEAGLLRIKTSGRERFCEVNPTPLNEIKDWLAVYDKFWEVKLGGLSDYLDGK